MEDWDRSVADCLDRRMANAPRARDYHWGLWTAHEQAGLAGSHFVRELTGASDEKFRQRVWEMALGRHLRSCGHNITTRPNGEPDFRFELDGQVVWVEAISPTPGLRLPRSWTTWDPHEPRSSSGPVPNNEMLLRYTSALKEKAEKGASYRYKGIVKPDHAFIVAIDGSQLSKFPHTHGISQVPFVVESVFAIGPLEISIDPETRKLGNAYQTVQPAIKNHNNALVPTERFLRDELSPVSAVLGCYAGFAHEPIKGVLPVQIAYNPLASCLMKPGQLGSSAEEWTAVLVSDNGDLREWEVKRV